MKKNGFTLIELLIVTVVIVTLMGIVFRLAGTGTDQKARAETIRHIQQLENALSGYYAAYGCYPPVPLQGRSRDIFTPVCDAGSDHCNGVQWKGGSGATEGDLKDAHTIRSIMAQQIEAACRAQPVTVLFPPNEKKWDKALSELADANGEAPKLLKNFGNQAFDKSDWTDCQVFQFGLLSFLLPRYSFMLDGNHELYDRVGQNNRRVGQWASQNQLPWLLDGTRPQNWNELQKDMRVGEHWSKGEASGSTAEKRSLVQNIASQAVCARWMPNFAKMFILSGDGEYFGVNTRYPDSSMFLGRSMKADGNHNFPLLKKFSVNGGQGGSVGGDGYVLDGIAALDGWGNELYYYSDPPYQSYRLWSSGKDGMTYPPWLDLPQKGSAGYEAVRKCLEDDIVHMSN